MRRVHSRPSPATKQSPAAEHTRATKHAQASRGQPLAQSARPALEARFGHDFSQVAIHTDHAAARAAEEAQAKAMAIGSHVFFADGKYDPQSADGLELLHHELTHVVQHERNPVLDRAAPRLMSHPGDASEREASGAADQLGSGAANVSVGASLPASISCDPDDDWHPPMVAPVDQPGPMSSPDAPTSFPGDTDIPAAAPVVSAATSGEHSGGGGEGGGLLGTIGSLAGVPHAGVELSEGVEATSQTVEGAEGIAKGWQGLEGVLGPLAPGIESAASGSPSFAQTVSQAQFAQGAGGTGGASVGNALAPLALAAGVMESGSAISDMSDKGANLENTPELVQGALETTSGGIGTLGLMGAGLNALGATGAGGSAVGAAAAAAPVGMVAGAGALGMLAGKEMGDLADSSYTKTGAFGTNADTGKNQSAMDWGASWGSDWDKAHNNSEPSIMGGTLAGLGGIAGGIGGAVYGAGNWLSEKL
jgi:hypothetical protein